MWHVTRRCSVSHRSRELPTYEIRGDAVVRHREFDYADVTSCAGIAVRGTMFVTAGRFSVYLSSCENAKL